MRKAITYITAAMAALCLGACGKGDFDTRLAIRPRVIQTKGSATEGEPGYMVRVYACYIAGNEKTDTWIVSSYSDADAGIFTNKITGRRRVYDFMSAQADYPKNAPDEKTYINFTFSRSPVLLVAVDEINKFYAYRVLDIPTPMPRMEVIVRFVLYRPEVSFKESEWTVVNGKLQDGANEDETTEGI